MRADRLADVLEWVLPQVFETRCHFALDGKPDGLGGDDAAGSGHGLEPSGHVDAIAVDGAVGLLDHVAQVEPNAKEQRAILREGVRTRLKPC